MGLEPVAGAVVAAAFGVVFWATGDDASSSSAKSRALFRTCRAGRQVLKSWVVCHTLDPGHARLVRMGSKQAPAHGSTARIARMGSKQASSHGMAWHCTARHVRMGSSIKQAPVHGMAARLVRMGCKQAPAHGTARHGTPTRPVSPPPLRRRRTFCGVL